MRRARTLLRHRRRLPDPARPRARRHLHARHRGLGLRPVPDAAAARRGRARRPRGARPAGPTGRADYPADERSGTRPRSTRPSARRGSSRSAARRCWSDGEFVGVLFAANRTPPPVPPRRGGAARLAGRARGGVAGPDPPRGRDGRRARRALHGARGHRAGRRGARPVHRGRARRGRGRRHRGGARRAARLLGGRARRDGARLAAHGAVPATWSTRRAPPARLVHADGQWSVAVTRRRPAARHARPRRARGAGRGPGPHGRAGRDGHGAGAAVPAARRRGRPPGAHRPARRPPAPQPPPTARWSSADGCWACGCASRTSWPCAAASEPPRAAAGRVPGGRRAPGSPGSTPTPWWRSCRAATRRPSPAALAGKFAVTVGTAGPIVPADGVARAFAEARTAADTLVALGRAGHGAALADLGFVGLVAADRVDVDAYLARVLGPLLDYDAAPRHRARRPPSRRTSRAARARGGRPCGCTCTPTPWRSGSTGSACCWAPTGRRPERALELQLALRLQLVRRLALLPFLELQLEGVVAHPDPQALAVLGDVAVLLLAQLARRPERPLRQGQPARRPGPSAGTRGPAARCGSPSRASGRCPRRPRPPSAVRSHPQYPPRPDRGHPARVEFGLSGPSCAYRPSRDPPPGRVDRWSPAPLRPRRRDGHPAVGARRVRHDPARRRAADAARRPLGQRLHRQLRLHRGRPHLPRDGRALRGHRVRRRRVGLRRADPAARHDRARPPQRRRHQQRQARLQLVDHDARAG